MLAAEGREECSDVESSLTKVEVWHSKQGLNNENKQSQAEDTVTHVHSDKLVLIVLIVDVPAEVDLEDGVNNECSERSTTSKEQETTVLLNEGWRLDSLHDLSGDLSPLGHFLVEASQGCVSNGGLLHIVHGIVALVDGLTQQEEVV